MEAGNPLRAVTQALGFGVTYKTYVPCCYWVDSGSKQASAAAL